MQTLQKPALAIDAATDNGDEGLLRHLGEDCERRLTAAVGEDRVTLRRYQANTYSAIIDAKKEDPDYIWNWQNPDAIQNILLLRKVLASSIGGIDRFDIALETALVDRSRIKLRAAVCGPLFHCNCIMILHAADGISTYLTPKHLGLIKRPSENAELH